MGYRFMVSAGEASADHHAAALISSLKKHHSDLSFFGMGGRRMAEVGFEKLYDSSSVNIVGFLEVIPKIFKILGVLNGLKKALAEQKPDALILVDLPDFNIRLARYAHKLNIPVIYYIPPQLWAWRKGRIKPLSRYCDLIVVVFPFEEEFFKRYGVEVYYPGHPFADLDPVTDKAIALLRAELGIPPDSTIVGLLPGSRRSELVPLMPEFMAAAVKIKKQITDAEFVIPVAPTFSHEEIKSRLEGLKVHLTDRSAMEVLTASKAAIVCSGTATLESAWCQTPFVVSYKTSLINELIVKLFLADRIKFVAMPNIIAGKEVAPELLQKEARADVISEKLLELLRDGEKRASALKGLAEVKAKLGQPGVTDRVAERILEMMTRINRKGERNI